MPTKPQRREVLAAVLATGLPALVAQQASAAEPALNPVTKDDCIAACNECLRACREFLIDGCPKACAKYCLTCLETCRACIALIEFDVPLDGMMARVCAKACDMCANKCSRQAGILAAARCIEACERCRDACLAVAHRTGGWQGRTRVSAGGGPSGWLRDELEDLLEKIFISIRGSSGQPQAPGPLYKVGHSYAPHRWSPVTPDDPRIRVAFTGSLLGTSGGVVLSRECPLASLVDPGCPAGSSSCRRGGRMGSISRTLTRWLRRLLGVRDETALPLSDGLFPQPTCVKSRCWTCGADWTAGIWTAECPECGGGALEIPCPLCSGRCGMTLQKAVADSNDFGMGHWIGSCGLKGAPLNGE
jgi:hypothetical protein